MQRREFLRTTTALTVAAAGGIALGGMVDVTAADAAKVAPRYRGTRNGRVLVSHDSGRTWRLLTNFGPKLDASRVKDVANKVTVHAVYGHHGSFNLRLQPDGRTWRTI